MFARASVCQSLQVFYLDYDVTTYAYFISSWLWLIANWTGSRFQLVVIDVIDLSIAVESNEPSGERRYVYKRGVNTFYLSIPP